ncbi:MAG: hypothetical protein KA885_01975 [Spirochaetes bacterium]|nr:hypothetical protein [Spirochaetota bacterium]
MKKAVFITVRSDSTRLPGKAYKEILGKSVIELIMLRAKLIKNADMVVVCTTEREIDNQIIDISKNVKIFNFRGSLEDKLDRWLGAAKKYNIDYFATFDGDDLLCDPYLIDLGLTQIEIENLDFLKAPDGLAIGSFTYCIKVKALEKVCSIKDTNDTEMMWTYFEDTGLFNVGKLKVTEKLFFDKDIRLTLDYQEDFDFFTSVFNHFNNNENKIPLIEIMKYLKNNPGIVKINSSKHEEWKNNQIKKTKLVLKGI